MDIKKLGWITVGLVVVSVAMADVAFGPQEVTLSSKKWACVHARPAGIGAECVEYQLKDLGAR
jgi:hypothetical protein